MLFWAKKFIAYWMLPLSFCVTAIFAGWWLVRTPKRARLGRALILSGVIGLLLFGNSYVSKWLIRPLEYRYPTLPEFTAGTALPPGLAECRHVVVLGGGNGFSPGMAATNLLSTSALARVIEAVRILRVLPDAKLIVSGPRSGNRDSHATVLGRAAQSLGIAPERIVHIDHARDTEDESRAVRALTGTGRVALVTSAWHMPRSMALFRSAGVSALACPADYQTHLDNPFYFDDVLWEVGALQRSTLAVRERIGYLWIWLRGKS
ncbi:MAG: ElyC/SanA/YdcF family protein [Opitutaceae bacterium]|nr:ElyC/SanA/YdcF family protein [Opitutaceae bacterium]